MAADARKGFPVVLTLFAAVAFAILCGFGTWQLQRLGWKRDLIARIDAAQAAAPVPLADALRRAKAGEDVDWMRVEAECLAPKTGDRQGLLYALHEGQIAWRAMAVCRLGGPSYRAIIVDRGISIRDRATIDPASARYPAPGRVRGILRSPRPPPRSFTTEALPHEIDGGLRLDDRQKASLLVASDHGVRDEAPVQLIVEAETPEVSGLRPAPLPANISNRHLEYVITWFGLALALAGVYAAMLMKRLRG